MAVWPFCRPCPRTSVTVMPPTLSFSSASRTSSTLLGRSIALTSFIRCLQHAFQALLQCVTFVFVQLPAGLRHMQDIDRLSALRGNQREIQVASLLCYHPAHPVQQSRGVVCDELEDGVFLRVLVVEVQPRRLALPPPVEHAGLAAAQQR